MKPLGIKAKVALATSITSILMIALVTVVQTQRLRTDFTKVLFDQQTALVNRTAEELDDKLSSLRDILALTAHNQPPAIADSADRLRAYYRDRATLSLFDDFIVLSPQGKVVVDLPELPNRVGVDVSDRAYFQTAMRTRKPMISEPIIGKATHQPQVQIIAPVLDQQGQVACLLVGVLRLYRDNVLGHLRVAKVGLTGYYFALTRGEPTLYVLHPEIERLLQPGLTIANPATVRALRQNFEGTTIGVTSKGVSTLNSYKRLKSVDWLLATSLPAEEAFGPFNGVLSRLLLWSALGAIATAAVIGWLTWRLVAPLARLRNAIVALRRQPDNYTPLPVVTEDEVGQLTVAFNELMRERLAADTRLERLIEFAPNAVVVVNTEGRIETFNREAERCWGYRRDEVLGQPLEMLAPERERAMYAAHHIRYFAEHLGAEPARMWHGAVLHGLRRDGSEFPIETNLSTVHTDQGAKVLAMISDITERHRLQLELEARATELEQQRDRAEAANRAKSEFVANMSHEIRTPMNAVLGMVYLLGNTQLTPQQRKYLNMVRVSGQSLLGILNDVLDFSKIEARHMQLSPVDFMMDDVMNSLATMMTMNAGDKELELAISVDPAVPRHLRGDSMRLQQILVNLAGNAIKFTEQGEVLVSVELTARDEQGALLRFEVRDTGIGMTEPQMGQLFNAFSQADQSITRRFGGTGLGLAITKRLIELMGGQIAVTSRPGQGSTFWFSLPFDVLPEQPDERRKPLLGQLRLLLADDSRTSRELVARLIRAWGWQVDEVDSGEAALRRYRQSIDYRQPYDVVIADWHMPGMDGLATAKSIREAAQGRHQPIVVTVNAFARDRMEEISNAPEADVVLVKPITSSNLFDALHQALAVNGDGEPHPAADLGIGGALRGAHFLLVEDNVLNQAVARGILEHAGATLEVAGDGRQAVEALRDPSARYDMVLMDMQMPVMDGFTATRILRQELQLTLPIIAMTAGVLESERERSMAAGISDFIPKPIEVDEMMAVLRRHLRRHQAAAPTAAPVIAPPVAPGNDDMLAATVAAAAPALSTVPPLQADEVKVVGSGLPAGEAGSFNMDSLMRVMGKDAKGRAIMFKMVRGALDSGMQPLDQAGAALREGRYNDAASLLHALRGSVGALGAQRLVQAALAAEDAINAQRADQLEQRYQAVRTELEQTLAEARAWLDRIDS